MSYGTVQAEKMTTESGYSLGAGNASSFKNRIINGGMMIDQRNAGASVTPATTGTYATDRWRCGMTTGSKFSFQQSSVAPTGFANSLLLTATSSYAVGSAEQFTIGQYIEGYNVADLAWGTASAAPITISFWVRSSLTGLFGATVKNSANDRSYPFGYTISSANTWEQKTVTIAGDTSGTWLTTTGIGIALFFGLGTGSSFLNTGNSWYSGNYVGVTGQTNLVGTSGATLYITGVQFEVGTVATSFDFRSYGTELALCQRYYVNFPWKSNTNKVASGIVISTTVSAYSFGLSCPMRTDPTVTYSAGAQAYDAGTTAPFTSIDAVAAYGSTISVQFTSGGGGLTQGRAALIRLNASGDYVAFSAEL